MMQIYVTAEIATYEYDCTGRSRKADLLTEEFPAECDAGRTHRPVVPARDKTPKWSQAIVGKPSTRVSFEGHDFPLATRSPGDSETASVRRRVPRGLLPLPTEDDSRSVVSGVDSRACQEPARL